MLIPNEIQFCEFNLRANICATSGLNSIFFFVVVVVSRFGISTLLPSILLGLNTIQTQNVTQFKWMHPCAIRILKMDSAHTRNSSIFFCRRISIGKAKSFTWFGSFEWNVVCIDEGCGLAECIGFQRKFINSFLWFRNAISAHTPSLFLQFNHRFYLCNPCNVRICERMRNADASFDVTLNAIMQPDADFMQFIHYFFFIYLCCWTRRFHTSQRYART